MITIKALNVNQVYPIGILHLNTNGIAQASQHGNTLEMPEPVSVMYQNPRERVLFDATRDSNPYLNLFEALWIIAGREDVKFLQFLVDNMKNYSDDGTTYYGAYGHRMRGDQLDPFPIDQIKTAIERLRKNPDDRQVVITIRDAHDMGYKGKDNPCNLLVSCKIRNHKLNIHVFNRSNDFVWGMTGTNVVQFSMLQEYMAGMIGCDVGFYHQTTDSMHVYTNEQWDKVKNTQIGNTFDPYDVGAVEPYDMMDDAGNWDDDLKEFFTQFDGEVGRVGWNYSTPFFKEVVQPMWESFLLYKEYKETKEPDTMRKAQLALNNVEATDWGLAATQWLSRRK